MKPNTRGDPVVLTPIEVGTWDIGPCIPPEESIASGVYDEGRGELIGPPDMDVGAMEFGHPTSISGGMIKFGCDVTEPGPIPSPLGIVGGVKRAAFREGSMLGDGQEVKPQSPFPPSNTEDALLDLTGW